MARWFEQSYIRFLVDNHITEDDPSFMRKFDPKAYVAMMKKAGVDAAMVYACCHNGNCYYPTKVGHMHKSLNGRDIFGETIRLLRAEGIVPLAYYTTIFHNHSAKTHPEWRTLDPAGKDHFGRYWTSCPNNLEYRKFTCEQIAEVIAYDVESIFVDMTFWPCICLCPACRERWRKETGDDMPKEVDWRKPEWVRFQRVRERWVGEFAQEVTDFIKSRRPEMTVVPQFSPVLLGWYLATSPAIARAADYTCGDFYGGKHQQRLATKTLAAFSRLMPYEYMTSRCVDLADHTSMKSEAELLCACATTLANAGACCLIDAINPEGTLVADVYDRFGRVTKALAPFTEAVKVHRPVLSADTGLYVSLASHVADGLNGMPLEAAVGRMSNMAPASKDPQIQELLGASIVLNRAKIPYRAVTSETTDLSGLNAIVVTDAAYMSGEEVQRLREFVRGGGTLIATGLTSYYNREGETTGDFALADVFGVSWSGKTSRRVHFLVFDAAPRFVLGARPATLVQATSATVLAGLAEPMFDPDDPEHYASIHSNPPGRITEYAGLTVNEFGKGKCVYLCSSLLAMRQDAQQSFGVDLLRQYAPSKILLATNAPTCVEVSLLKSTMQDAYLLCLVNYQDELPNVPVEDVSLTLRLPNGQVPKKCRTVSDNRAVDFKKQGDRLTFHVPRIETVEMIEMRL